MAICPAESIHIAGLSYAQDFFAMPGRDRVDESFLTLMVSRRSVRVFKETPVSRELLQRIVELIASAPMAYTPSKVQVTVVQSRQAIERALPHMVDLYQSLIKRMENPFVRFGIRRKIGPATFTALTEHVLPIMKCRVPEIRAGLGDSITWGAPAMLLFHAHRNSGSHTEDAFIALTYGLLAAHALGLGATAIGLVAQAVERTPELRTMLQIPAENEVLACMIVGYPKYRFKRGIRRELAGVQWI
jgi:nitroreductase